MNTLGRVAALGLMLACCSTGKKDNGMAIDGPRPRLSAQPVPQADSAAITPAREEVAEFVPTTGSPTTPFAVGARPPVQSSHDPSSVLSKLMRDPQFSQELRGVRLHPTLAEDLGAFGQLGIRVEFPQERGPDIQFQTMARYHVADGQPAEEAREQLLGDVGRATQAAAAAGASTAATEFLSLYPDAVAMLQMGHRDARVRLEATEDDGDSHSMSFTVDGDHIVLNGIQELDNGELYRLRTVDQDLTAAVAALNEAAPEGERDGLICIAARQRDGSYKGRCL